MQGCGIALIKNAQAWILLIIWSKIYNATMPHVMR